MCKAFRFRPLVAWRWLPYCNWDLDRTTPSSLHLCCSGEYRAKASSHLLVRQIVVGSNLFSSGRAGQGTQDKNFLAKWKFVDLNKNLYWFWILKMLLWYIIILVIFLRGSMWKKMYWYLSVSSAKSLYSISLSKSFQGISESCEFFSHPLSNNVSLPMTTAHQWLIFKAQKLIDVLI